MAREASLQGSSNRAFWVRRSSRGWRRPGYAGDPPKLTLTGSATMATDYMFRSVSNTNQNPAAQPEFDLTYGIFYLHLGLQYRV